MSFGFSVGDFLAVIELANKIRRDFVGAPKQFQDISMEIRNLDYAIQDVNVFISEDDTITKAQEKELHSIRDSCQNVLKDCQDLLTKYSGLELSAKGLKGRTRRAWQRLTSEPTDVRDLRARITSNITQLSRVSEGFTRDNVVRLVKGQDELARRQDQQENQEILDWLTPIDFAAQQSDYIRRRQPGTGQWLLDSPEYRKWVGAKKEALFFPGIPGAGKTILSSIIVENLQNTFHGDSSIGICYVYCNFRRNDEQTLDSLIASLLKQLARGQSPFPGSVKDLYDRNKEQWSRPSTDELLAAAYSRVYIVIDALDECLATGGCRSRLIFELKRLQASLGANILITSRFIPEITAQFVDAVQVEIRASESDISTYLNGHLPHLPSFVSRDPKLQAEIKKCIMKCVDGMFLLAQLHLDSLRGKRSPKAVRTALEKLAKGSNAYDAAYHDAMTRINGQITDEAMLAHQTLSWITCAKRPLKTIELQHALGVELNEPGLDEDNLPDLQDLVSKCCGLVTIDEESDIVRLVHYTTQEYFERTQTDWFPDAQSAIAETCTTYLAFNVFEIIIGEKHACSILHSQYRPTFLLNDSKVEAAVQGLLAKPKWLNDNGYSQVFPRQMTGLHLAALLGLHDTVSVLIQCQNLHGMSYNNRTPLSYAPEKGYEAKVDMIDQDGRTPLSYAACGGHEAVVCILLDYKAEVNFKNEDGRTLLSIAVENGDETVVRLLLEHKAEVDSIDQDGRTPVLFAVWGGHEAVLHLLLEYKAEVDSNKMDGIYAGRTPLSFAAEYGDEAVVRLLLEHKANVDAADQNGTTPLLFAVLGEHEVIIGLLLEYKAKADLKDKFNRTPLSHAAWGGQEAVVRLLLEHKAEVDSRATGKFAGRTPLSFAAEDRHEDVVRILLEQDVEVDSKDQFSRTPLSYAAESGNVEVVRQLLRQKAEVDSKGGNDWTPISCGAWDRHEAVVRLLLEYKAEVDSRDQFGRTPLSYAAWGGYEAVVRLLLEYEANPWLNDHCNWPPLFYAIEKASVEVFGLLLGKHWNNANMTDRYGSTLLSIAARFGRRDIVAYISGIADVDITTADNFNCSSFGGLRNGVM
ncbi:hypothetical protein PG997_002882 [Apiospora hydei]|uniref:NACHT domain-containing protein n=1 Tax=Apiospora hydei TaxID=1337664 RepID=A0ABR1WXN0_9PEZI